MKIQVQKHELDKAVEEVLKREPGWDKRYAYKFVAAILKAAGLSVEGWD
jgi:hypothetical protein